MNRNVQNNESSLLLQMPKSVLSFSDISGNSFLLPVAVENVVDSSRRSSDSSNATEDSFKVSNTTSVCQLQQPLLKPRSSPGPKTAVPYSQSAAETTNIDSGQIGMSHSRSPQQPSVSNVGTASQPDEITTWPSSSSSQPLQSSAIFTGFQNQSTMQADAFNQSSSSVSASFNQDNIKLSYQTAHLQGPSATLSSNYPSSTSPAYPGYSEKAGDFQNVTSAGDYFSQPPIITPNNPPSYYTPDRRILSELPQPSFHDVAHQTVPCSDVMNSEMFNRLYEPVKPYWVYKDIVENREVWYGFSYEDSDLLESTFQRDPYAVVPVDGGRYDAYLGERKKKPAYFEAKDLEIRRAMWFYLADSSQRYIPFPEEASNILEQHYHTCVTTGHWQKRINIPGVGGVALENPQLLLYYKNEVEIWPTLPDPKSVPKNVKRGLPENYEVMNMENDRIDHLVFIVQGIGSFCDLRFRTVAECVNGVRDIANKLIASHFSQEVESGRVGRVEFLPVAWHAKVHTNDKGFDRCMRNITLPSIPKLRHFTNDTLLDILLYSSPFYCQTVIDTVASEMNKIYEIFLMRNPQFSGKVFVAGHSLGSLILFDILTNQKLDSAADGIKGEFNVEPKSETESETEGATSGEYINAFDSLASLLQACQLEEYADLFEKEKIDLSSVALLTNDDMKDLGLPTGPRKKLLNALHPDNKAENILQRDVNASELPSAIPSRNQSVDQIAFSDTESLVYPFKTSPCMSSIVYPKLDFEPSGFFALGSPIAMFLTVRGYDAISPDFRFPTCPNFFHIFHPYDPVAFRIEPLIDPNFSEKPILIPHHKGRKRMHLEIRENLSKVGLEIKQKVIETLWNTWNSLSGFARAHTFPSAAVEAEVDKLVNEQMSQSEYETQAPAENSGEEIRIGALNGGRRIDYVLQEKPIEALNDYIFALTSHATYWNSEDTVLMILREIYATQGIFVSSQSDLESRRVSQAEGSTAAPHSYAQLSSVMSSPSLYESSKFEQAPRNVSPFSNQNVPSPAPPSSQSLQSLTNYNNSAPPAINDVPPLATTAQPPLGPPPLKGFVKRSPFTR